MNNNEAQYIIESNTSLANTHNYNPRSGYNYSIDDSYLLAISKNDNIDIIHGKLNSGVENFYNLIRNHEIKEGLYINAIRNIRKQKDYLQLIYQLENDYITENEFEKELELNEDKYLINTDNDINQDHFKLVLEITEKIGQSFSELDISEIFSISLDNVNQIFSDDYIKSINV